jgi:hypothetical protein
MACKGVSRVQSISMAAIMIGYRLFKVASVERQVKVKVKYNMPYKKGS